MMLREIIIYYKFLLNFMNHVILALVEFLLLIICKARIEKNGFEEKVA